MGDLFRSALNYLSSAGGGMSVGGRTDHELVGTFVEVGGLRLRIKSLIAEGGPVINALRDHTLTPDQVIRIFYAACQAVNHMHSQNAPITHRDMKVENLLLDQRGVIKLCDFGSATTETYRPDDSWSANRRSQLEDQMCRYTTPMYRAPEMLDLYLNYPIGPALDIWALGCILYYLCYRSHPFEDSAKLRIINANYTLPEMETPFTIFHPLIESTLQVEPRLRPNIGDLCERVEALAAALSTDLHKPLVELLPPGVAGRERATPPPAPVGDSHKQERQSPVSHDRMDNRAGYSHPHSSYQDSLSAAAGGLFGSIRGQAGSIFKNLKDTSAKVVQSVQAGYGGKGPDLTYLTSRLVLAPMPEGLPEALTTPMEEALKGIVHKLRSIFSLIKK